MRLFLDAGHLYAIQELYLGMNCLLHQKMIETIAHNQPGKRLRHLGLQQLLTMVSDNSTPRLNFYGRTHVKRQVRGWL